MLYCPTACGGEARLDTRAEVIPYSWGYASTFIGRRHAMARNCLENRDTLYGVTEFDSLAFLHFQSWVRVSEPGLGPKHESASGKLAVCKTATR